jgi:hypothetical protein
MRRLSGKASRRLDICSKVTVAAPRTRRERGSGRGGGGDLVAAAARYPVAAACDPAAAVT